MLLPGNRGESKTALALLAAVVGLVIVGCAVCNQAYSDRWWREAITETGAEPVVSANRTHPRVAYSRTAYWRRHHVKQGWRCLKEWQAVVTRYEETAGSCLGMLHAAALEWVKDGIP